MNKKILVCGAGGFIGGHLVCKLKQEGHYVTGVDLKFPEFLASPADEFYLLDLRSYSNCRSLFDSGYRLVDLSRVLRGPLHGHVEESIFNFRLKVAGSDGRIVFVPAAVKLIYKYSRGTPRLINAVCDNVLLAGYVAGVSTIDARCVKKAIEQLEGSM